MTNQSSGLSEASTVECANGSMGIGVDAANLNRRDVLLTSENAQKIAERRLGSGHAIDGMSKIRRDFL